MMPSNLQLRQLTNVDLAKNLQRRVHSSGPFVLHPSDGGPIHEVDAYSASPAYLANAYQHGAGTDQGGGKGRRWYFITPARYHPSPRPNNKKKRWRAIGGGDRGDGCCTWHSEGTKLEVQEEVLVDGDGDRREISTVGYARALCCGSKKKGYFQRCGWCMQEFGLHKEDGHDKFVLCVLYRSPRASEGAPIPDESLHVPAGGASEGGPIPDESLHVPAGGASEGGPAAVTGGGASDGGPIPDESLHVPAGADVVGPAAVTGGGASEGGPIPDESLYAPAPLRSPGTALLNPAFPIAPPPRLGGETPPTPRVAIVRRADPAATGESVVMKFGSSSIPSAGRLKDVAKLVCAFPARESLVVVLSGMGNTNHNILQALTKVMTCDKDQKVIEFDDLTITKQLYLSTAQELGLDTPTVTDSLDELERRLQHVAETKYLTSTARDYLMSFGERTSTKLFFEYLDKLAKETPQEWGLWDVITSGRGGSDLTATTIARTLRAREIQVWKDVLHGVFTCDPKVSEKAIPIPFLTYDEAAELKLFDKQSIQLAMEDGISVVIMNLCIPQAPATVISKTRDISKSKLTGIVLESNITILCIESTCGLEQSDFVAKALSIFHNFAYLGISLDRVATSAKAGNMSITLVPSKLLSQGLIELVLNNVDEELKSFATVRRLQDRSVISLIGNGEISASILRHALSAVNDIHVQVENSLQESSKVAKVLLVVPDNVAERCVKVLHRAFFEFENGFTEVEGVENGFTVPVNPPAAASSGDKRKAEAAPCERQRKTGLGYPELANLRFTPPPEDDFFLGGDFCGTGYMSTYLGQSSGLPTARMESEVCF